MTRFFNSVIDQGQPAIILYGNMFKSIRELKDYIENMFKTKSFFNDFKKYGKIINEQPILIFDALNEYNRLDRTNLIKYLKDIALTHELKLVVSYRDDDIDRNTLNILKEYKSLTMYGFDDDTNAAIMFSEYFNIDINEMLEINFNNNPLLMKIYCETYHKYKNKKGERGKTSATFYIERYFKALTRDLVKDYKIQINGKLANHTFIWNKIAKEFAKRMVINRRNYVKESEFIDLVEKLGLNVESYKFVEILTSYNFFNKGLDHNNEFIYSLSYQRFSDYLITRYLMNDKDKSISLNEYFNKDSLITYLNDNPSIVSALVEEVPIRTKGKELYDVIDYSKINNFERLYIDGLTYRSKESFRNSVDEFIKNFFNFYKNNNLDLKNFNKLLYSVMLIDYHPFNFVNYTIHFLKEALKEKNEMIINDFYNEDKVRILSLLMIPRKSNLQLFKYGLRKNLLVNYMFLLSLSNREFRNKATKSILSVIEHDPKLLIYLLTQMKEIKDQYCKCQCQSEPLYWCEIEPLFNSLTNPLFL